MTSKIYGASSSHVSLNDRGYVDLPREAVLDDTVSPAEQRAFAKLLFIPAAIPVALFAPEAALLAGLVALTSCGSPGEAEDPILTSFSDAGYGEISPDAGTTDEGDGLVATDDGMTDTGDMLVAADDGGMIGPDEGVTIADDGDGLATTDDGTTIADVLSPPEDGVQDLSDASEVKDGPDVTDGGDGLNALDDGAPIVDVVTPPDVALPEDGVQELSDASEVKDGPDVIDSGDGVAAADDGATVTEVVDPSDVAPPQDGSADQEETAIDTDAAADTAKPCSPSCIPVAATVTCDESSINIPVNYFVKCATQFVCDGIGTSLVSVNLPDPTTQTTQSVTVDKCINDILFGGCQAINGDLSEYCGEVNIAAKLKTNTPPIVDQLTGPADKSLGILPSGDQCFSAANNLTFNFSASDKDNDALTCGLKIYQNGALLPAATVSATFNNLTKPLMLQLSANLLQPRTDYCWNVSCDDGKGGVALSGGNACFTTSEKGLIGWWSFNETSGSAVGDKSGSGANGTIFSKGVSKMWSSDLITGAKMLCFNGVDEYVSIATPNSWYEFEKLSFRTRFSKDPGVNQESIIFNWGSDDAKGGINLALVKSALMFGTCVNNVIPCSWDEWASTNMSLAPNQLYNVTGIINMGSSVIYVDNNKVAEKAQPPTKELLGKLFVFGKHAALFSYYFKGCIDDIGLYNVDVSNTCP